MIKEIEKLELLIKKNQVGDFDDRLDEIIEKYGDNSIVPLIELLNDNYDYPDVLWGIIHSIESLDGEKYSESIVGSLPSLIDKSEDWAEAIIFRNLNSPEYFNRLLKNINRLENEEKEKIVSFIEKIIGDDRDFSSHKSKIVSLR